MKHLKALKRTLLCCALILCVLAASGLALADSRTAVTLSGQGAQISGDGASAEGSTLYIRKEGTYELSGEWTQGQVVVSVGDKEDVTIVLNGVSITNPDGPAIYVENADETEIILAAGSENTLVSGTAVDVLSAEEADDEATGGAVFAKDDLEISGEGTLFVGGYLKNGIHCSNDLVIRGGNITVQAVGHALKGKTSVTVAGGTLALTSAADAIQTSESEKEGKGFILMEDGTVRIETNGDGIQAGTDLTVSGGDITVTAGGGAKANASASMSAYSRWGYYDWYGDGGDDSVSQKGLKAGGTLLVKGGSVTVDSRDDALHASDITLENGKLTLSSGDDGAHADHALNISGGDITLLQSYEGLEGNQITISGGNISVTATDDGVNAYGGSANMGRGWNWSSTVSDSDLETPVLTISGGTIYVNAGGDGLDSNGNMNVTGGDIVVDGPSDSGNAPLDPGSESGGRMTVSGGILLAVGSSGMAESFDQTSTQASFLYTFSSSLRAGQTVTVSDASGKVLISHTLAKAANCLIFSSPDLQVGQAYTVSVDGTASGTITLNSISTGTGSGMGGWGGFGGGRDRQGNPGGGNPGGGHGGGRRGW